MSSKAEQMDRGVQIVRRLLAQADELLDKRVVEPVTLAGALLAAGVNLTLKFSERADVVARLRSLADELENPEKPGTVQ